METFTEEQKIAATARIGQDILSYALEVYTQMDTNTNTNTNSSASQGVSSVNHDTGDSSNSNNNDNNNNNSSALSSSSSSSSSSQLHPLNEALEDAFCILQSPLSKVNTNHTTMPLANL